MRCVNLIRCLFCLHPMLSNAIHLLKLGPVVVAYSIARAGARFSKGSGIVAKFLAHKSVNFASLSYSFYYVHHFQNNY